VPVSAAWLLMLHTSDFTGSTLDAYGGWI